MDREPCDPCVFEVEPFDPWTFAVTAAVHELMGRWGFLEARTAGFAPAADQPMSGGRAPGTAPMSVASGVTCLRGV